MCLPTLSWNLVLWCASLPFPETYCCDCLPIISWDLVLGCASLPFPGTWGWDVPPYLSLGPGAVMYHPTFSWDLVPWCASLPFPSSRHPWASFLVFFCPIFVFICFEVLAHIITLANQLLSWSSVWYSCPQFLLLHTVDRVFFLKPNSENANILLPEDKSIPKHQWFFKDYPVSFKFLRKPHHTQN